MKVDCLVVGAGFAGSVVAERVASAGYSVLVIDKREHIAGNAYDTHDASGVLVHVYGPHIFHTNSSRIYEYLSNFTSWRPYEHRVRSVVDGCSYPFPINQDTINLFYGLSLDEEGIASFLQTVREPRDPIRTSEDLVISTVGRALYEKFFRGYTQKQWGLDPSELFASVAARIPVRHNRDDRYFTDKFQAMPENGYTAMFANMLCHPNIDTRLGVDYREYKPSVMARHTVYTGPIDEYFDHRLGRLPYRSLRFEHQHLTNVYRFQETGTVNYPNDHGYTRITEFKHLTGQKHVGTSIVREYPQSIGDPYYPIPRPENDALYREYERLALAEEDVTFVGRLARYRYLNMDQVVGSAINSAESVVLRLR